MEMLRQAMRIVRRDSRPVIVVTALVVLPAATIIGGYVTLLLLATAYPVFLLVSFGILGARVAELLAYDDLRPLWRDALTAGSSAALALATILLVTTLILTVIISAIVAALTAFTDQNGNSEPLSVAAFFAVFTFAAIGIYLLVSLLLGVPCATFGAWLRLRKRPHAAPRQDILPA